MQRIVTGEEMRKLDGKTIEKLGIPVLVLMERAAAESVNVLQMWKEKAGHILVLSGTGNNGGDGLAVGRILIQKGFQVTVVLIGSREKLSEENSIQIRILENMGIPIKSKPEEKEYDIIVDALFGTGLKRPLEGEYRETVKWINSAREKGALVCSLDIPSGICSDTGKIQGCAVCADMTVAYGFAKRGELLDPGRQYTGQLLVRDIGIDHRKAVTGREEAAALQTEDIGRLLPARDPAGNKGTFGKVLLAAGSSGMCGAAVLSGKSAFRSGAGMVMILTPECNRQIIQQALPEAILSTYETAPEEGQILQALQWADVLAAGPGMGQKPAGKETLRLLLQNVECPMVLDADALNMIAEDEEIQQCFAAARKRAGREKVVITPHPGELCRLAGCSVENYKADRFQVAEQVRKQLECVVVSKDAVTVTLSPDGKGMLLNPSGNDAMATAGSGDVLTGLIGGLIAQGGGCYELAGLAVYIHGLAGDLAALGRARGVMAGDLTEEIPRVFLKYQGER